MKKKFFFSITALLLMLAAFKLFYKTMPVNRLPKSADCIAMLDVKRVINTALWNIITTPGRWKFSTKKKKIGEPEPDEVFDVPDYLFAFHCAGQNPKSFYILLDIKSDEEFSRALRYYGFRNSGENEFFSEQEGLCLYRAGNTVLLATGNAAGSELQAAAREIFISKSFAADDIYRRLPAAKSDLAIYLAPGIISENYFVISGNFDRDKITVETNIALSPASTLAEANLSYSTESFISGGFTQSALAAALGSGMRATSLSAGIGVDADSFFIPANKIYSFNLAGIVARQDSAVTYSYDDDFNRVAATTVNMVKEPSFRFSFSSDNAPAVMAYLKLAGKIEPSGNDNLFLPMPLVKSYCAVDQNGDLRIQSVNYQAPAAVQTASALFLLHLSIDHFPPTLFPYLPARFANSFSKLKWLDIRAVKQGDAVNVRLIIQKRQGQADWF